MNENENENETLPSVLAQVTPTVKLIDKVKSPSKI